MKGEVVTKAAVKEGVVTKAEAAAVMKVEGVAADLAGDPAGEPCS